MAYFIEKNLKKIVFFSSIILVAILTTAFGFLYIQDKFAELEENLPRIEADFINQQKEVLQYAVSSQIRQIDFHRRHIKSNLKSRLRLRIVGAKAIAENIVRENKEKMGLEDLEKLVMQALRPIIFNEGRGYVFAISMEGEMQLFPPDTSYEGRSISELFSGKKLEAVKGLHEVAEVKGEGWYEYDWPLPGEAPDLVYRKLSYVSHFKPFNWFIGAGEYYRDFGAMTKKNIAAEITESMGKNPKNYFFIYDLHNIQGGDEFATMLVNPNRPDLIGTKLSDNYQGAKGTYFRKEFLAGLQMNGEAFVTYWYKKEGEIQPKKKLSYFKIYPEWNWVVAKGVYLDDLDLIIDEKKRQLQIRVKKKIGVFALFLLLAVLCALVIAHFFTNGINSIFVEYKRLHKKQHLELERANRYLHKKATTDHLTGIYNRQYFNERLGGEINRSNRYNNSLSLVLFDIDFFKQVNDDFGHLEGDKVLKELTHLISSMIRKSDMFARWGGEEFAVLLVEMDEKAAILIAEKLCIAVADHTFSVGRRMTCSFGTTTYRSEEGSGDFINRADQALYLAKQNGRNRVEHL